MNRAEFILKCKEVRQFLLTHPESTSADVHADVEDAFGCLVYLGKTGAATYTHGGKAGPSRWTAVGMPGIRIRDVHADLSGEEEAEGE